MELSKRLGMVDLPLKGKGVVALERISKGEEVARWFPHDRRTIDCVYHSLDDFEAALDKMSEEDRCYILNHSWPTPPPEGKVAVGATGGYFGLVNHSSEPTVLHEFLPNVWITTANVDFEVGDELCYDYNLGSKYEVRTDAIMLRFHEYCARNGVVKRPSQGMTAPACKGVDTTHAEPLPESLAPIQTDGAVECSIWI